MNDKTLYDLSDEEYERYESDPYSDEAQEITANTMEDSFDMMFDEDD